MRIADRRRLSLALLAIAVAAGLTAPVARAQGPEFVALAHGAFPQLGYTWQGLALRPNAVTLDLYNAEGALFQSYTPEFTQPPPKRSLTALGYRPVGLPTTAALVAGTAGTRVKTVKVFFSGAPTVKLRPVPAPTEWAFHARFFAAGAIVPDTFANTTQVVTRIKALDRKGKLLTTLQNVFTNPF
jgi:hypothetical protein